MPNTTQSASWDFSPNDPVHLASTFSFDTEDTQDSAPVAGALAASFTELFSLCGLCACVASPLLPSAEPATRNKKLHPGTPFFTVEMELKATAIHDEFL